LFGCLRALNTYCHQQAAIILRWPCWCVMPGRYERQLYLHAAQQQIHAHCQRTANKAIDQEDLARPNVSDFALRKITRQTHSWLPCDGCEVKEVTSQTKHFQRASRHEGMAFINSRP